VLSDTRAVDHVTEQVKHRDTNPNKKHTTVPKRITEKIAIAEYLRMTRCTVEIDGRTYDSDFFWNALRDVSTEVDIASEEEQTEFLLTEDDKYISEAMDALFDSTSSGKKENSNRQNVFTEEEADDSDSYSDAEDDDVITEGNNIEMRFELVGEGGEAEDSDCDENEAGGYEETRRVRRIG
jgi:hypothetical protein